MRTTPRGPLTPIFDDTKRRGAVVIGNSPPPVIPAGTEYWWDFRFASVSGGDIVSCPEQTGNPPLIAAGSPIPAGSINGNLCLDHPGNTDGHLDATIVAPVPQPYSVVLVAAYPDKTPSVGLGRTIFDTTVSTDRVFAYRIVDDWFMSADNLAMAADYDGVVDPHLYEFVYDGANSAMFVDGALVGGPFLTGSGEIQTMRVASNFPLDSPWKGRIGLVGLVAGTGIGTAVTNALLSIWGI